MSGITPLLDTLLHQVLGKRVDVPVQRDLNEPVRPTDPSRAPRAVHSDSRLDARQPSLQGLSGAVAREGGRLPGLAPPAGDAPASTHTHFSQAARTIADILLKFPAPPSTLRPAVPLVASSRAASLSATQLASQLQASINYSGLFYESHLGRWFRGDLPRQVLEAQPQMQVTQGGRAQAMSTVGAAGMAPTAAGVLQWPAVPVSPRGGLVISGPFVPLAMPGASTVASAPSTAGGAGSQAGAGGYIPLSALPAPLASLSPSSAPSLAGSVPALPAQAAAAFAGQAVDVAEPLPMRGAGPLTESANELLQGLIRHQLEVLVSPVLRWEGDVWSGIFMALMIQLPDERERSPRGEEGGAQEDEEPAWHSTLSLTLPALGEIHVELRLKGERVALTLESASHQVVEQLDAGKETLRQRLTARGFSEVALLARLRLDEGDRHE